MTAPVEPVFELQAAVVQRLRATAAVTALVPAARILDAVPERETFPYLVFDGPFSTPDRTFGQDGREISFTLTAFTTDGTERIAAGASAQAGYRPGMAIAAAVVAALTGGYPPADGWTPITVAGFDLTDLEVLMVQGSRANDGVSRQVDMTFVATLERQAVAP